MNTGTRWVRFLVRPERALFASRLWSKRQSPKHPQKAELQQWESEGGNVAPSSAAQDNVVTTGSA
jgi:hypothetical protein